MRAWAQKMGFQNMAPLSLMLSGKRGISKKYVSNFIQDLNLSSIEGMYLENLIDYNRAQSIEKKEFYYKRLKDLHPKKTVKFEEVEMHDFFKDPIHYYLLDIIDLPGACDDVNKIKKNLQIDYSVNEIKKALARLEEHGFIFHADGRFIKLKSQFTNKVDIPSQTVQDYHKACAMNAIESLQKQEVSQREFNGFVLPMKKEDMQQAKVEIREFYKTFISKYENKEDANTVYQLNVQFFKIFENIVKE
jgi:uncharacterized protein (TIGR02147 family)